MQGEDLEWDSQQRQVERGGQESRKLLGAGWPQENTRNDALCKTDRWPWAKAERTPVSGLIRGAGLPGGHTAVRTGITRAGGHVQHRTLVLCAHTSSLTPEGS